MKSNDRIDAAGPAVILSPDAVQYLGLALHELATNALKHGALAGPSGQVSVRWQIDKTSEKVRICWSEKGGTARPCLGNGQGFGHVVIEADRSPGLEWYRRAGV